VQREGGVRFLLEVEGTPIANKLNLLVTEDGRVIVGLGLPTKKLAVGSLAGAVNIRVTAL
jgi:hypothetical protein